MAFDNKGLGLPDLPPSRTKFSFDHEGESNSLPSFPDSPNSSGFSQAAIKDAVAEEHDDYGGMGVVEMEEWSGEDEGMPSAFPEPPRSSVGAVRKIEPVRRFEPSVIEIPKRVSIGDEKDVFVQIDKFHAARRALVEVQQKMEEIDELIKKIRETKMREEQELGNWESDLTNIKSRIKDVSESIFEKA